MNIFYEVQEPYNLRFLKIDIFFICMNIVSKYYKK
jgi:hypothetical protein